MDRLSRNKLTFDRPDLLLPLEGEAGWGCTTPMAWTRACSALPHPRPLPAGRGEISVYVIPD